MGTHLFGSPWHVMPRIFFEYEVQRFQLTFKIVTVLSAFTGESVWNKPAAWDTFQHVSNANKMYKKKLHSWHQLLVMATWNMLSEQWEPVETGCIPANMAHVSCLKTTAFPWQGNVNWQTKNKPGYAEAEVYIACVDWYLFLLWKDFTDHVTWLQTFAMFRLDGD